MSEVTQANQANSNEGYGTGNWRILMASAGIDMFLMRFAILIVNVCTVFIAVPFTTVFYYNAWCQKVTIDGKNLKFTGTAGGFFMTWLKTLALSIVTLSLYWWFRGSKNKARWVDSNLSWA
tara:strand:- start:555 stop:917 length:363 start_codon:yes stop_codon:yes gene_type:complete